MAAGQVKYTSPSGREFSFLYENLSKETDLKTAAFTFPERDGAYIQDLGAGGRRFPLSCIFSGADCAARADEFEAALEERGVARLEHPVYGARRVVPTGTVKRSDALVSDVFSATVEATFSETIADGAALPGATEGELAARVEAAADEADEAAAAELEKTANYCAICGGYHERTFE